MPHYWREIFKAEEYEHLRFRMTGRGMEPIDEGFPYHLPENWDWHVPDFDAVWLEYEPERQDYQEWRREWNHWHENWPKDLTFSVVKMEEDRD